MRSNPPGRRLRHRKVQRQDECKAVATYRKKTSQESQIARSSVRAEEKRVEKRTLAAMAMDINDTAELEAEPTFASRPSIEAYLRWRCIEYILLVCLSPSYPSFYLAFSFLLKLYPFPFLIFCLSFSYSHFSIVFFFAFWFVLFITTLVIELVNEPARSFGKIVCVLDGVG